MMGHFRQEVDSLKIEDIHESDKGVYVCIVNNTVGSERAETTLSVWGKLNRNIF